MNVVEERRRHPRGASGSGGPAGVRQGTEGEWVIRSESREGCLGFSIFLPTGEHIGFERDRRRLLDLLAGAGVSAAACETLLLALEGSGEARAAVFVRADAATKKAGP
jgi:hypothetical protein